MQKTTMDYVIDILTGIHFFRERSFVAWGPALPVD